MAKVRDFVLSNPFQELERVIGDNPVEFDHAIEGELTEEQETALDEHDEARQAFEESYRNLFKAFGLEPTW